MLTVRQWRKAKELSVSKMAELLGIHANTYTSWEENPSKISIGYAFKIASILSVSIDDIDFLCNSTLQNIE